MTTTLDLSGAQWITSSHSGGGGNCVEVALHLAPALVPVRDSKDPAGPALTFGVPAWSAFLAALARGEFDN